jgi:hypothetical protein
VPEAILRFANIGVAAVPDLYPVRGAPLLLLLERIPLQLEFLDFAVVAADGLRAAGPLG